MNQSLTSGGFTMIPKADAFCPGKSILQSGLFTYISKRNGVYNYRRCYAGK